MPHTLNLRLSELNIFFIIERYQMRFLGGKLREDEGTHLIKKIHFPNKGPGSLKSSIKGSEGPCLYRIAIL